MELRDIVQQEHKLHESLKSLTYCTSFTRTYYCEFSSCILAFGSNLEDLSFQYEQIMSFVSFHILFSRRLVTLVFVVILQLINRKGGYKRSL